MPVITQRDGTTVEAWDTDALAYTRTVSGTVVVQRPFTDAETAYLATVQQQNTQGQNGTALRLAAATALVNDQAYLAAVAAGTVTTAMAVAQVAALTRQVSALIRLAVGGALLNTTDGA